MKDTAEHHLLKDSNNWANRGDPPTVPGVASIAAAQHATISTRFDLTPNNRDWDVAPDGEPELIRPGDQVIDNNGQVYTVQAADDTGIEVDRDINNAPTQLWYGRPPGPGRSSPTVRIVGPISGGVRS